MISKGLKEDEVSCRVENCIHEMNECIEKKFQGYELEFTVGACRLEKGRKISTLMNKTIYASEVGKICSLRLICRARAVAVQKRLSDGRIRGRDFRRDSSGILWVYL